MTAYDGDSLWASWSFLGAVVAIPVIAPSKIQTMAFISTVLLLRELN
jgi:hypothetical protein